MSPCAERFRVFSFGDYVQFKEMHMGTKMTKVDVMLVIHVSTWLGSSSQVCGQILFWMFL